MCDLFSGIKFWSSERNTENTISHLYFNEIMMIILRKIHVKMKSFAPPLKETKHIHASADDLLHTVLE